MEHAPQRDTTTDGIRVTLDTYQSRAIADVFVTVRAVEARCVVACAGLLGPLRLEGYRRGYEIATLPCHDDFFRRVAADITARGFALHGFDVAFERRRSRRTAGVSRGVC